MSITKERRKIIVEVDEIKQFDFFSVFSEEQLEELSKITEKRIYEKSALVYQRRYEANRIYMVTKGLISLNRLEPGEKISISFEKREQGELFGAACFMESQEYTLTAVCMSDSEVMELDADKLLEICKRDPELGYKFLKEVAQIYFERYKVAKRQVHEMIKTPTIITALPG
jgi:CRP-like cAMP-binding protein